ncbi:MAG: hypothetical protein ACHP79_14185, partial [Terriglobales bacterium]
MARRLRSERMRLLITLAFVVFPAAALIGFSVLHLRSIQRDRAIEAAIQRDFQHMMAISEKRMAHHAYDMVDEVQPKVPCAWDSAAGNKLQAVLETRPHLAHVFTWSKGKTVVRSQSRYGSTADVQAEGEKMGAMITGWFDMEGAAVLAKLQKMQSKGERPYMAYAEWVNRNGKQVYEATMFFPVNENKEAVGGLVFDPDFLQDKFFPEMMNNLMAESEAEAKKDNGNAHSEAVMMIHAPKEPPLATCSDWDGGMPEMERKLEAGFPGLMLAMKFRGTTVEAIGQKFLRTSFLVLGGLSLLLAAGIVFTYRGVHKEM